MPSYCLKCKNAENINPRGLKTSTICGTKKSRFIKKQEACGILNNLCVKTRLSKIPLFGDILF